MHDTEDDHLKTKKTANRYDTRQKISKKTVRRTYPRGLWTNKKKKKSNQIIQEIVFHFSHKISFKIDTFYFCFLFRVLLFPQAASRADSRQQRAESREQSPSGPGNDTIPYCRYFTDRFYQRWVSTSPVSSTPNEFQGRSHTHFPKLLNGAIDVSELLHIGFRIA